MTCMHENAIMNPITLHANLKEENSQILFNEIVPGKPFKYKSKIQQHLLSKK